ncbi:hypothetical protein [Kineococcus aurantiacus]|uniref:Uncharacterized protein n=1 Tax=Kineococcus aurantiacus TaxID=37633 RepID=A0A7Y9AS10_9ACTN|nr:hypothetical protein [Kineococcus aurantiacus]NYD20942.1 hypothetical protein [Kineococcus aurantiacus]
MTTRLTIDGLLTAARLEVHDLPGNVGLSAIYVLCPRQEQPQPHDEPAGAVPS